MVDCHVFYLLRRTQRHVPRTLSCLSTLRTMLPSSLSHRTPPTSILRADAPRGSLVHVPFTSNVHVKDKWRQNSRLDLERLNDHHINGVMDYPVDHMEHLLGRLRGTAQQNNLLTIISEAHTRKTHGISHTSNFPPDTLDCRSTRSTATLCTTAVP